ncbi:MAG: putative methyltransferase [Halioglobus sp.]|jgi:predicted methyltransferase
MSRLRKALIIPALIVCWLATPVNAQTISADTSETLDRVITGRSTTDQDRDVARHPAKTLGFFQVEKGMTVAEALPEGGWYTRILAPYLGAKGTLYGVNYMEEIWPLFGFMDKEAIEKHVATTNEFPGLVKEITDNGITVKSFTFSTVPEDAYGTVDRVLIIRALHNLNRFESSIGSRSQALAAVRVLLKKDGLVGVVQHRLAESADDAGADGSRGYLKQSAVIAMFKQAGFELLASSEINANSKDKPGPKDIVWRLPPSLSGAQDTPEAKAAMLAIGESDRMTLLFKKAS